MVTWRRVYVSAACLGLLCCGVRIDFAQDRPAGPDALPLTVPVGAPLHIVLTKKVPVKHAGVPVEGKVAENVYVFDHLVIPAGSRVMGQVTKVDSAPRKQRALAIANGNFTPLRHAHVDFNTLVEADGKRIPLQTNVLQGAPSMVHMVAGGNEKKKKGRVASKVEEVHQQVLESGRGSDQQCDRAGQGAAAEGGAVSKIALPSPVFAGGHKLHRRTQNALDLWYGNSPAQAVGENGRAHTTWKPRSRPLGFAPEFSHRPPGHSGSRGGITTSLFF